MKKFIATVALAILSGAALAAIPVRWSVDTFRVKPLVYECYHGETLDLAADLNAYGEPIDLTGKVANLYWQTNGMGQVWWKTNATIRAEGGIRNIMAAEFSGAYDPGADVIEGFIGVEGENYRASFTLRLRHSPGFTPAELDLPAKEINCETVVFLNPEKAPWPIHACDTNSVNALIFSYDTTNLTLRFNGKLDLPPTVAPTNWIPVSVGNGKAEWMPNTGGGGGTLGSIDFIRDADGKAYPVYATTNAEGTVIQVVGQIPFTPPMKTVEQEEFRAVTVEQMLYTNQLAETAARIATDLDIYNKLNEYSGVGRFISTWDCATGRPGTEPIFEFIEYKAGDYYMVGRVSTNEVPVNYIPHGTIYYKNSTSEVEAVDEVYVNDIYRFTDDGNWVHVIMKGVAARWDQIQGDPLSNTNFVIRVIDLSTLVTTNTVTKEYVESLGIETGISTNAVQYIIDQNVVTNNLASYTLAQTKIPLPADTVPSGYYLRKGTTNAVEWAQGEYFCVGYLGYIRDETNAAYRVMAMTNPEGQIVVAVEQTPTPVEVFTVEEEWHRAANAETNLFVLATNVAWCATNYTDSATNALRTAITNYVEEVTNLVYAAAIDYTDAATNALWAASTNCTYAATNALWICATNYTDRATNALSGVLLPVIYARVTTNDFNTATNDIWTALLAETAAREAADTAIRGELADETAARIAADAALSNRVEKLDAATNDLTVAIAAEKTRAETAEAALSGDIAQLNTDLTAEKVARIAADAALSNRVQVLDAATNALQTALAAEITRSTNADATHTADIAANATAITTEQTRATTAEGTLQTNIGKAATAGTNYTDSVKAALHTEVETEKTRAQTAEGTLQTNINNERTRAETAENNLAASVNTERERAQGAEGQLGAEIANEASRAQGAEGDLNTAIENEKTRAQNAEGNLNTAIGNEKTRAQNAEDALSSSISSEAERARTMENSIANSLANEVTRAKAAEGTNATKIATLRTDLTTETNTRSTEDDRLQLLIEGEQSRATGVEASLIPKSDKGANGGVATLGDDGKIPASQIPSGLPTAWGAISGEIANQTDLSDALAAKQAKLPEVVKDYYLHANYIDGHLEWKGIEGGDISNYNALAQKPIINGNVLTGGVNLASADLGLQSNLVVDLTVANKVLKNDGSTLFWGSGGGGGSDDCIPITKTVASATDIKNLFELAFEKSWDDIPQNSSMIVYATGLPYADNTFPNSEGYCILRYRTYRYAYIEFICPTVAKNGTKFNKMQNGTWKGWTDPPLPVFNIKNPTSYMDLFNKMGYSYNMDGFTASGIATGLNIDPAKGDYFPHPNCYVTLSSLNNACYRIQASGFNQTGVLWERREESGDWRPWTRIDGNVSQKTIWGDYKDCDSIFLEAFCTTNSQPDKATITGYAYNLNTAIFPEMTGFITMRQVDSNNKQIEFRSINPDTPVKYNSKTNGVWTGWKSADALQQTALILNGGPEQITGPMVIPNGYGTAGQVLVSNGSSIPPSWGDIFDIIYPVGSIYISVGSTLPTAFTQGGRTWEKLSDGQFLMNTTGTTGVSGGSNSRTLTTANMPAHSHGGNTLNPTASMYFGYGTYTCGPHTCYDGFTGLTTRTGRPNQYDGSNAAFDGVKTSFSGKWTGATTTVGSGTAFDNRPSYLSVSMWKRTN